MTARGFGMIEVLVTMIIIAVGLLGLAGLQARAQRVELESYQRVQALVLLEDIASRLRANRRAAEAGCYNTSNANGFVGVGQDPVACTGVASEDRAMADEDMGEWDALLEGSAETRGGENIGSMAGARGCVTANAANTLFTVSVAWQGEVETAKPTNNCAENQYGDETLRRVVSRTVRLPILDSGP